MKITENLNDAVKDANGLSLAISIVVAVLIVLDIFSCWDIGSFFKYL